LKHLKARKTLLEKELRQVAIALDASIPATKAAAAVVAKPARKPMSQEAKEKSRAAHLRRRHQPQTSQAMASEPAQPTIPTQSWKASE